MDLGPKRLKMFYIIWSLRAFLKKVDQSRSLFCPLLITISIIQIEKGVDGVLVIRTHGRKMVGADKTTQLWWPHVFALNILFAQITKVFKFWMIEIVFVGDTKS